GESTLHLAARYSRWWGSLCIDRDEQIQDFVPVISINPIATDFQTSPLVVADHPIFKRSSLKKIVNHSTGECFRAKQSISVKIHIIDHLLVKVCRKLKKFLINSHSLVLSVKVVESHPALRRVRRPIPQSCNEHHPHRVSNQLRLFGGSFR